MYIPNYIELYRTGELDKRIDILSSILEECTLCPRECRVNRLEGERGICRGEKELMISSAFPHFGEEPPLVGFRGSGTIFLANCNLRCIFCQNFDISHEGRGNISSTEELAANMLYLQGLGCHNINLVTPTHYTPQIISALPMAIEGGLELPLVWNCGGYESIEIIRLLDGIVDIYMPDVKYSESGPAERYSAAPDYPSVIFSVLKEMHRQVGDLEVDSRGIPHQGLLVRHLIMPHGLAGTRRIVEFISRELSTETYINIMDQYRPCYRASDYPELSRRITIREYEEAVMMAKSAGLKRGFWGRE